MTLTDKIRKALTIYLGECWLWDEDLDDEGMCKKCGQCFESHRLNRTFDTDADMMALFRRIYYNAHWDRFVWWLKDNPNYDTAIPEVFLETEKFCFLVSEWLRKEKK